jgi:hypothetical protein
MSKGIAEYTARHGRALLLILAALSIVVAGGYVAYPYSHAERVLVMKIGKVVARTGLSMDWAESDVENTGN